MTAIVKPADLLGLVAFRTVHALVCRETNGHALFGSTGTL